MTSDTTISILNAKFDLNTMKIEQDGQGWDYTALTARKHNDGASIVLRSTSGGNDLYLKLDAGEAAQLRDHISALIVDITPKPKTEQELFDEIPVGSDFIWVIEGSSLTPNRYRKLDNEFFQHVLKDGTLQSHSKFSRSIELRSQSTAVSFRVVPTIKPLPSTVEEQYNAFPIGRTFKWHNRKNNVTAANTYIKVPGGSLPLGYARGEVWSIEEMFSFGRDVELIPANND